MFPRTSYIAPNVSYFRINLQTGKKEAKILDQEQKKKQDDSIGVIDDDEANPDKTESGKLRSYQELQDTLAEQKMKLNTEFEQITVLVENFANATTGAKINIMEDLEYYLHQFDNADDFAAFGGLERVLRPAVETSGDADVRAKAAVLFGSCVQGWIPKELLETFDTRIIQWDTLSSLRLVDIRGLMNVKISLLIEIGIQCNHKTPLWTPTKWVLFRANQKCRSALSTEGG